MLAAHEQIKKSYESLGMTPDEIAEDQNLEIEAVKSGLMQCSTQYRKDCGLEAKEGEVRKIGFTDDQRERALAGIFEIGMTSEVEAVRLKALIYVRDDSEGRLEPKKAVPTNTFNFLEINQQLRQAGGRASDAIKRVMNVESKVLAQ